MHRKPCLIPILKNNIGFVICLIAERIQRRYGELNGELLLVELKRGQTGLGISLAGNKDRNTMSVFVAGIQPDSSAALDGQIQVGDELLEVTLSS